MAQSVISNAVEAAFSGPTSDIRPVGPAGETVSYDPATLEEIVSGSEHGPGRLLPEIFREGESRAKGVGVEAAASPRKKHVHKMRDYIVEHAEELLAKIVSRDNGKLCLGRADDGGDPVRASLRTGTERTPRNRSRRRACPWARSCSSTRRTSSVEYRSAWSASSVRGTIRLSIPFGEVDMAWLMAGNAVLLEAVAAATITVGQAHRAHRSSGRSSRWVVSITSSARAGACRRRSSTTAWNKLFFTGSVPTGSHADGGCGEDAHAAARSSSAAKIR